MDITVADLLRYRSNEAALLCQAGHIMGHPAFCEDGCRTLTGFVTVADVIQFKPLTDVDLTHPLQVEDGCLIDGHHRVKRALHDGVVALPVEEVIGVAQAQLEYHASIAAAAAQPHE